MVVTWLMGHGTHVAEISGSGRVEGSRDMISSKCLSRAASDVALERARAPRQAPRPHKKNTRNTAHGAHGSPPRRPRLLLAFGVNDCEAKIGLVALAQVKQMP